MVKTTRPLSVAFAIADNIAQKNRFPKLQSQPRSSKGRLIRNLRPSSVKFINSLNTIITRLNIDASRLVPLRNLKELRAVLIDALERLKAKNITAITASAWLGETFQIIVERHPAIIDLMTWSSSSYIDLINIHILTNNPRAVVINSNSDQVHIKKLFKTIVKIDDIRLKRPGEKIGQQFFDTGMLASNVDKQYLPMPMEIKTRGAGKELPQQKANFIRRLAESPVGTRITYSIEGQGVFDIDIKNLVLIREKRNPQQPLEANFLSRIGVISGKQAIIRIAKDKDGIPYTRVKLPTDTDLIGIIIQKLLQDKSWQ